MMKHDGGSIMLCEHLSLIRTEKLNRKVDRVKYEEFIKENLFKDGKALKV